MNAVWRVARAAVRRRGLQTILIGVVAMAGAATMVLALGLLVASSAPFDRAHATQLGAHVAAGFDRAVVSDEQLTRAAGQPRVQAVAGPFGQADLELAAGQLNLPPVLTAVGRADPEGLVDRLTVWQGRWLAGPGEIVLERPPGEAGPMSLGTGIAVSGGPTLTIVGFAYSVSQSADAWVTPDQMSALRPTTTQMLYRFTEADTAAQLDSGIAAVTAGLPSGSLLGSLSYLTIREKVGSEVGVYIPFLIGFGVLGLVVALLIVANVVSGAVVAGLRHIGVLKAIGFTPNQVMAVYLVMVCVPAMIGCLLGMIVGNLVAAPVLTDAFRSFGTGETGVALWVDAVVLLVMPAVVALAALLSALRARRLPAAEAVSAGSAQHTGRALAVQRWLSGTRLPRSVSLGLGLPFARPARSALTLAAIILGSLTVTLATGVTTSVTAYRNAVAPTQPDRVELLAGPPPGIAAPAAPGDPNSPETAAATLSDTEDEAMLRAQPGVTQVAPVARREVQVVAGTQGVRVLFFRGDSDTLGPPILSGHRPDGPGQVAVPSRFLNRRGLALGDNVTVALGGVRTQVRIVAVVLANAADTIFSNWATLIRLTPAARADSYQVQLAPGTDRQAFAAAVASSDPGLRALPVRSGSSTQALVIVSAATILTLVLGIVAALGVFNTVVLNTRERRRDLGTLKSIGMTPRQVTVMMVTSMGALGVVGGLIGLPLGITVHRLIVPAMVHAAQGDVIDVLIDVYRTPGLVLLALSGIAIAVLGALIPARSAARLPIAAVLRSE